MFNTAKILRFFIVCKYFSNFFSFFCMWFRQKKAHPL
uniref:Uncharacterized protein n=1 Tax=Siphoviridae sp. ctJYR23 TaxID=2827837 RepID=A0A8S5SL44_9CAUD|nr:MAG TPA: hypothetical protein [Siphoviridae sp. ctJYR23]